MLFYALIPATLAGVYFFGLYSAYGLLLVSIISAVLWEAICSFN